MHIRTLLTCVLFISACNGDPPAPSPAGTSGTTKPTATATASAKVPLKKGKVFFITPLDGASVFPDVDMSFGVENREIVAAGAKDGPAAGHYHVIVGGEAIAKGKPIPKDDKHVAFAKGEKFGQLKLDVGKHKLTLQLADGSGKSYGKELSQTIEVEVIADQGERSVALLEPKDGAKVKSPVKLKFDVKGMKIVIAGEAPKARTTGHHHVLIGHGSMDVGAEIPADKTHIHFGKGQTEAEIELPKGKHQLTAQFADGSHRSYGKTMAHTITIEVE